jgi:hypothetical protein
VDPCSSPKRGGAGAPVHCGWPAAVPGLNHGVSSPPPPGRCVPRASPVGSGAGVQSPGEMHQRAMQQHARGSLAAIRGQADLVVRQARHAREADDLAFLLLQLRIGLLDAFAALACHGLLARRRKRAVVLQPELVVVLHARSGALLRAPAGVFVDHRPQRRREESAFETLLTPELELAGKLQNCTARGLHHVRIGYPRARRAGSARGRTKARNAGR